MSPGERLRRRLIPRAIVAASTIRWPRRLAAALRRRLGGEPRVRLYFAFDDPYSAVALIALFERVADRGAQLIVSPVVKRGIADDPAREAKRRYAVTDSRRLARRFGAELSRAEPLAAEAVAFLARWAQTLDGGRRLAFSVAAMRRLWLESEGPIETAPYAELWKDLFGERPPGELSGDSLPGEREMSRRRLYDTPVAVVHGQWFFAHERVHQIEHRLDELGWQVRP